MLKRRYRKEENMVIVHGSAEKADVILKKNGIDHADYIVSGLPFTSLPKEISLNIFDATKKVLGEKGVFITFQYTLVKKKFFEEHFEFADCIHVMKNLPPAYVFVLKARD